MNFITENQTEYQALFTFWGDEEAEVVVCFDAKRHFTEEEKQEVFRQVATKVEVRELFEVAQEDLEEEVSDEQFCEAVYFYDLYCEVGEDLICTFDVDTDPDYFLGHLVNIRLDDNYQLHLETISG